MRSCNSHPYRLWQEAEKIAPLTSSRPCSFVTDMIKWLARRGSNPSQPKRLSGRESRLFREPHDPSPTHRCVTHRGTALGLAAGSDAPVHRHHYRKWLPLLCAEVCHRLDRLSNSVGKPTATEHTVTHTGCLADGDHCAFDSGLMLSNGTFALPGLAPGRYPYLCRIHPIMRGVITVTDGPQLPSQL